MKALIQRVKRGSVSVDSQITGKIDKGFVVLLGVKEGDKEEDALHLAHKTVNLRVFPDEQSKMNLSIQDINGEILVISQFTLYADTRKGNRPSFAKAAPPELAESLYNTYIDSLARAIGKDRVAAGVFGAMMTVEIINDGPVTVELTSDNK
ncbi:D-aminoacyl-tRNA deacylase [Verrucomicrobiota bacterium]